MNPSPYYLLLTNPSWAGHEDDLERVLTGVRGGWTFDPNEGGETQGVLGVMLRRWYDQRQPESSLLNVADALLKRGSDPSLALAMLNKGPVFDWHYYAGAQSLLHGWKAGLDPEQSLVGAQMLCIMGDTAGTTETRRRVEKLLDGIGGWKGTVHGVAAISWLALHACHEGSLGGWSGSMFDSTADYFTKQLRQMRALATAAKGSFEHDDTARFSLACGMLLASTYTPKSSAGSDACSALSSQAIGLLEPVPETDLVVLFQKTLDSGATDPYFHFRLSMAVIKGLAPRVQDKRIAWGLVGMALPHLHEHGTYLGGGRSLDEVLNKEMGLPPASFYEQLPVNNGCHEALLHIFMGQFRVSERPDMRPFREQSVRMLDDMIEWADGGQLNPVNIEPHLATNYYLKNNTAAMDALDRYQEAFLAQSRANALSEQTTPVQVNRSMRRI